jgi:hypothetical protein
VSAIFAAVVDNWLLIVGCSGLTITLWLSVAFLRRSTWVRAFGGNVKRTDANNVRVCAHGIGPTIWLNGKRSDAIGHMTVLVCNTSTNAITVDRCLLDLSLGNRRLFNHEFAVSRSVPPLSAQDLVLDEILLTELVATIIRNSGDDVLRISGRVLLTTPLGPAEASMQTETRASIVRT